MKLEKVIQQKEFKDEYQKLIVNLLYTNSWLSNIQAKSFKKYDMTVPQYNILRILRGQYPKPSTVKLLTERMIDKMSNASRIIDRLEKKGFVHRTISQNDRRAVDVTISDRGLKLLTEMDHVEELWCRKLAIISPEEAKKVNDLLDKMRGTDE